MLTYFDIKKECYFWLESICVLVIRPQDTVVTERDFVLGDPVVFVRVALAFCHNTCDKCRMANVQLKPLIVRFNNLARIIVELLFILT
jgi:hypothetical protein